MWPETPLRTYNDDGTPPFVDGNDLNAFQKAINQLWSSQHGRAWESFKDDFLDVTPNNLASVSDFVGPWIVSSRTNAYTVCEGSGAGQGFLSFKCATGGGSAPAVVMTLANGGMDIGQSDLIWSIRVWERLALATEGIFTIGGSGFKSSLIDGNWMVLKADTTYQNVGVAVGDAQYHDLQYTRIAGVSTYYIDGTSVFSENNTNDYTVSVTLNIADTAFATDGLYGQVDYVKMLFQRL